MNLHATQHHGSELADRRGSPGGSPASGPQGRFAYASGAKPLNGYTIKRGIGHGGFGEVYFATSDAGKEVAIKLIRRNLDIELRGVTQCLNLKHPNLIDLYDVRQDDEGDNWVVMELVAGESLEDLLNRQPNGLPPDDVLSWIHGICAGVAYLHDHGIVHRDLKPGNIFSDEGFVKIGDYGLSKFISCSRRSGQTGSVGTVHYMAPEIANGRYGKEIDIYALGIILYEMLTGHVPFEGESVGEILMKHLTAEPDVSRVAEPYRTIISRALAKDLQKRFISVGEMIAMLPPAPAGRAAHYAGPGRVSIQLVPELKLDGPKQSPDADASTGFTLREDVRQAFHDANSGEPIARWVRQAWSELSDWWTARNFHAWQKLLVLFGGFFVALTTAPVWAPTLAIAAGAYLVYRVIRSIVLGYTAEPERPKFDKSLAKTRELAGLKPVYFSTAKALVWLFCSGAAMTVAAQTIELQGDFHHVLNDDDLAATIPIGGLFAFFGFLAIKAWRGIRRLTLGSRAVLPGKLYLNRRWVPWLLGGWVTSAWLIVAMDQGMHRMGDEDFPIVGAFMGVIAAAAAALSAVYRAAVPMSVIAGAASSMPMNPARGEREPSARAAAAPSAQPVVNQSPPVSESAKRRRWSKRSERLVLKNTSQRERFSQLLGSMLLSGGVCIVVALVTMILRAEKIEPSQYAWMTTTSILGAWAVLIPSKVWETASGDVALRRFVMLVMGLGLGLCAYGVGDWLLVQLPYNPRMMTGVGNRMGQTFYGADGNPMPIAFLAYFGFLFVLLRWWRLADTLRATRISIWHTAVAVFWGAVLSMAWPFPQPWGLMVAATIAVSVQLAAPWLSPSERSELQRSAAA